MTKKLSISGRNSRVKLQDSKKRTVSSRRWLERQLNDPFVLKAKIQGYRSRAAFKLIEIDQKFKLLHPGQKVVDLGAAPGGWTQVVVEKIKSQTHSKSKVIGVDLSPVLPIEGATILEADFTDEETQNQLLQHLDGKAHVVLSDMAAPACGMTDVDHLRIMALVEQAFIFAKDILLPGGAFVAKVLRGGTETQLLKELKQSFVKVAHFKPTSSRQDSAEMYVVGLQFRKA
jgi:23S rRNA (uridine2552-2'-O)-methyltransferase